MRADPSLESEAALDDGTAGAAVDLLAHWWSRPVTEEVTTWTEAGALEAEVRSRMPGSGTARPLALSATAAPGLFDEHERLFIGPGPAPCPPYESYWREDVPLDVRRSLMGPCTAELRRIYGQLGLEVTPTSGELPDHIAVELEALAYALSSEQTYPQARALFSSHLRHWLGRFCRAVAHEAESTFYRDLSQLTMNWAKPLQSYVEALTEDGAGTG